MRTATDIVVEPNYSPMPVFIIVQFDNYNGPTINDSVSIIHIQSKWIPRQTECNRIQLPVMPAPWNKYP